MKIVIAILFALATFMVSLSLYGGWRPSLGGWHIKHAPTADQLYGCTYEQSDPATGECK